MDSAPDFKSLASESLDAIKRADAACLRSLLKQGSPPDGWWDPVVAADQDRESIQSIRPYLADQQLREGVLDELMAEMSESFSLRPGPSSFEIPLHLAAEMGAIDCIHALLEAGADVNKLERFGATALFAAKTPVVVATLIRAGINVHIVNEFGRDAFQEHFAEATEPGADQSQTELDLAVCRAMLESGVPLLFRFRDKSRLYDAAFAENLHGVKFLLDAGHPVDADHGNNALHAICWHWDYSDPRDANTREIVRVLLEAGFDPNARGECGATPLHEALTGDGTNLVAAAELLAVGADINAVNDDGQTPLHLAYDTLFDYGRVVPFMIEHGANPLLRDRWGQTVIDIAQRMILGENPRWHVDQCAAQGGSPCGWKGRAAPGDVEYKMLELLKQAAKRFA